MRSERGDGNLLEGVFDILRFRRLGVVSFRKFIILCAGLETDAHALQLSELTTQPLRVHR